MTQITLKYATDAPPLAAASHAAKMCYQAEPPEWGSLIDVKGRLFTTGHHTTLQHYSFTFEIDGIAIGDVTFGLHLASVFYNSDQRSGRFCGKMFAEPNYEEISDYIRLYWPDITGQTLESVLAYVRQSVGFYQTNLTQATASAIEFLKTERPNSPEKYLTQNGPKIAQEQLRMLMPVIFPTGLVFTINWSALAAMHLSAWSPSLRAITEKMVELAVAKYPELGDFFDPAMRRKDDWAPSYIAFSEVVTRPKCELISFSAPCGIAEPALELMHPVDLLPFSPEMMDNNASSVVTRVEMSVATMGQDQRHRTIGRSSPEFTGKFYLPPILKALGLDDAAATVMSSWHDLNGKIPDTLHAILAPYGAMVSYVKRGTVNAVLHEQAKRLCWCAQEEIYHLGVALRQALLDHEDACAKKLAEHLEPACFRSGKCAEGVRYCGRDMSLRTSGDYFPKRLV